MTVSLAPLLAGGEARAFDIGLSFNLFASYQFVPAPLEQTPLQGVGVLVRELEDGDEQICTGIQLNSRIVLTAAHCVVSRQGEIVSPGVLSFYPGQRGSDFSEESRWEVLSVEVRTRHPDAEWSKDFALLTVRPTGQHLSYQRFVRSDQSRPSSSFPLQIQSMSPAELSSAGRVFTSVGYSIGFDWGETATWDQGCALYPDPEGVMLTDCSFTSGASGGPILMRNSEGTLRIVGLIQGMLGVRPRFRWGEQRFRVFRRQHGNVIIPSSEFAEWVAARL
jgi:V8-like Glu-specific endopeptidase